MLPAHGPAPFSMAKRARVAPRSSSSRGRTAITQPPNLRLIFEVFRGMESSPAFVRQPERNGYVERFIRTLMKQLRWVRVFQNVEQLLAEFRERCNQRRIRATSRPPRHASSYFALGAAARIRSIQCPNNCPATHKIATLNVKHY